MACPRNGRNIFLDRCQIGVPGERRVSTPQPLTTVAPQCWPQLPPSSSPSPELGLTLSVPSFPTHPALSLLLHAQLEIPSALSRGSQGATAAKHALLEAVWVLAFYTYHNLEVFGGNTKINVLIKLLLILPKQMWTATYQNAKLNNTVVQLLY